MLLFYNSAPASGASIQLHLPERSYLYPTLPHPPPPSLSHLTPPFIILLQSSVFWFSQGALNSSYWTVHLFSDLKFWWHLSSLRDLSSISSTYQSIFANKWILFAGVKAITFHFLFLSLSPFTLSLYHTSAHIHPTSFCYIQTKETQCLSGI